jgi:hypothetical protein
MIAPSRFLAWLVLPLLAACSFQLLAAPAEGAPQALHLLDFIGADYPDTVQAGSITDQAGFRAQQDSVKTLGSLIAALPDTSEKAALEQSLPLMPIRTVPKLHARPGNWVRSWPWPMKSARPRSLRRTRRVAHRCTLSIARSAMAIQGPATARRVSA